MALSTSTGTLAVGASRIFNLSPGSALTLVAPPNVRATITETPNTVSASGVGGNASRVHNLQLPQTVTYGPYPMGGTVVVANASNSGGAVTWVRSDALVAESTSGVVSLVDGDGNVLASYVGGLSPASTAEAASANVTAIQAALTAGGLVQILAAGTYEVNDTLVQPSNCHLHLGAGVTLKMRAGGNKSVLRNANYTAALTAVTGNPTSSGNVISVAATAHGLAVGDYACLMGSTVDGYEGIFPVASVVDANNLTLTADYQPANATSSGTVYIRKADVNITLSGPGVIDQDEANQTLSGVENHAVRYQGVRNLHLARPVVQNANKYALHLIAVQDFVVDAPYFPVTASDGLHIEGLARSGTVVGPSGKTGDDMLAFTCMKLNPAGAFAYTVPANYHPGNQIDINVYGVNGVTGQAMVKVTGTAGYTFDRIAVHDIAGVAKTAFVSIIDDSADLTGMSIGKMTFGGIATRVRPDASGSVYGITYNTTATVRELTFNDYVVDTSTLMTGAATFSGASATTIGKLTVNGLATLANGATTRVGFLMGANLTISEMVMDRISWNAGADASARLVHMTGGTISDFKGSDWNLSGNALGNGFYHAGGALTTGEFCNIKATGLRGVYENTTGATATPEVSFSNIQLGGSVGQLTNLSQSTNVMASNIRGASIGNNIFQIGATSRTFNIRASNISASASQYWLYGTTNTINLWADGTVPVDGTKVTVGTGTKGATFFNNNNAFGTGEGLYSVSNAGSAVKLT